MSSPGCGLWRKCLGCVVIGAVLVLVAAYAMVQTDQRPFCASCHIMQEAAVTHKLGTHADRSCNDCHAPHALLSKLPFKAKVGFLDFTANLAGRDVEHAPSVHTRDVVNANCIACHTQTNVNVASMDAKPYCVDCHRNVAHMRKQPLDTRTVAYE